MTVFKEEIGSLTSSFDVRDYQTEALYFLDETRQQVY